jgi:hypothetical protein
MTQAKYRLYDTRTQLQTAHPPFEKSAFTL